VTLKASGDTGLSWKLASGEGTLPGGLVLNGSSGAITGTPSAPGSAINAAFTVGVTDANGRTVWKPFTMPWQ
jgi:hypothetical protein